MAQQLSRYRVRAALEIAGVLDALPAGATRRDAERALRELAKRWHGAPGSGLSWPYQCWLRERRAALNRRWPAERVPCEGGTVRYYLGKVQRNGAPWLTVDCSWCGGAVDGGCLQCVEYHALAARVTADPEFKALRAGVAADRDSWPILADWLADRGIDAEVVT